MDKVFIEQLEVIAVIGVYDWEQEIKQKLVFDLELGCDVAAAAKSDDLSLTLDYATISETITTFVQKKPVKLVETLAEQLAKLLFEQFAITWLRLKVAKPGAVVNAKSVGVIIERRKQ